MFHTKAVHKLYVHLHNKRQSMLITLMLSVSHQGDAGAIKCMSVCIIIMQFKLCGQAPMNSDLAKECAKLVHSAQQMSKHTSVVPRDRTYTSTVACIVRSQCVCHCAAGMSCLEITNSAMRFTMHVYVFTNCNHTLMVLASSTLFTPSAGRTLGAS